jgi:hypothetical protein
LEGYKGSFCIKSKGATKKTQEKMNDLKNLMGGDN